MHVSIDEEEDEGDRKEKVIPGYYVKKKRLNQSQVLSMPPSEHRNDHRGEHLQTG